jgi:hypothetical protein
MAHWRDIETEAGDLAARVKALLDAHQHKTIATLRKDGAPRISGIEVTFTDGDLYFGGMPHSVKCLDLLRDPRFALHSGSVDPADDDPSAWAGDAKVAGRAVEITDPAEIAKAMGGQETPPGPFHLFRADLTEIVLTKVGDPADHLRIESWHEGKGVRTRKRH